MDGWIERWRGIGSASRRGKERKGTYKRRETKSQYLKIFLSFTSNLSLSLTVTVTYFTTSPSLLFSLPLSQFLSSYHDTFSSHLSMSCARIRNRPVRFLDPQVKLILELRGEIKRLRDENLKLRSSIITAPGKEVRKHQRR